MKTLVLTLIACFASIALAESSDPICFPGQVWYYSNPEGVTHKYVCAEDGRHWVQVDGNIGRNPCHENDIWIESSDRGPGMTFVCRQGQGVPLQ
jgi:hypothetical protein